MEKAKEKAVTEHLEIQFLVGDARQLPFKNKFDVAIMMCEGGFPLMETDEEKFEILRSISQSMKSNCKPIFTTLNGLFPIFNSTNEFTKDKAGTQFHNKNFQHFLIKASLFEHLLSQCKIIYFFIL
jgi:hypothetical protein